ncbi:hypothetical protein BD770DRAFT_414152 [Pilaira anomala]|nr:hypothetical protein BD770DRAFT_414152 [Pilaira anomala]
MCCIETDSYSIGELTHRALKIFSMQKSIVEQVVKLTHSCIEDTNSIRGENTSMTSASSKNENRTAPSTEKLSTKRMESRVDMLAINNNLEFVCEEDKSFEYDTKIST